MLPCGVVTYVIMDNMTIRERIYEILDNSSHKLTAAQICEIGEFSSRTIVSRYLQILVKEKKVISERVGRNVFYYLDNQIVIYSEELKLWRIREDEVWYDVEQNPLFMSETSENTRGALQFAFTEMLNNAIDHARSPAGYAKIVIKHGLISFTVRDYGVGVFRKVREKFGLEDEIEAIQRIMKGKTTTAVTAHSGEGIFWVSKLAERFCLSSYDYRLIVDNNLRDYTIEKLDVEHEVKGTEVWFEMSVKSHESLEDFFGKYLGDKNYAGLNMTVVHLGLYREGSVWISRSQAKRVLANLEKYERVVFDFSGIGMVGQAFCDEIFRVFAIKYPKIVLEPVNMGDSVRMMVERAQRDFLGRMSVAEDEGADLIEEGNKSGDV